MLGGVDKRVRDLMTRGVITVDFQASVAEVIEALVKNDVTGVVAVDARGEPMGVVSSSDIVHALASAAEGDIETLKAEDIMTPIVATVQPGKYLRDAARLMAEKRIHRLVIVSSDRCCKRPVGIISATDIVKELRTGSK